jgi:hypothetical protein
MVELFLNVWQAFAEMIADSHGAAKTWHKRLGRFIMSMILALGLTTVLAIAFAMFR